jgi:hypothetical protein
LRNVNLQAAEKPGEDAHQHRGQQNISFRILHFLRKDGHAVKSDKYQRCERRPRSHASQMERSWIVNRLHREKAGEAFA